MTKQIGYWVDMENPYVTYHNNLYRISMVGFETNVG